MTIQDKRILSLSTMPTGTRIEMKTTEEGIVTDVVLIFAGNESQKVTLTQESLGEIQEALKLVKEALTAAAAYAVEKAEAEAEEASEEEESEGEVTP